jgi:hypothetical protein
VNGASGRVRAHAQLAAVAAAAFVLVLLLAARTPLPSDDGCWYLWMARRFAEGRVHDAMSYVFPAGFPLLLAPLLALGADPERAAVLLGATCFAATVWPVAAIARTLHERAALPAALLWVGVPLLPRLAAEVYSEPPYLLLMAAGTSWGLRGAWWRTGLCSALAFWIRPEGVLLAASFALVHPRTAWRAAVPVALAVAGYGALRAATGNGFDPLPLLEFHDARDDLPERGDLLTNLLAVLPAWLEAFGAVGVLVALAPWRARPAEAPLRWQIAGQVAAVCTFVVRRRFFVSCAVPVAALAADALLHLPHLLERVLRPGSRVQRWPLAAAGAARVARVLRRPLAVAGAIAVAGAVVSWNGVVSADRAAERLTGQWLARTLQPDDRVLGDLPRVVYYAERAPGEPRRWTVDQLVAMVERERPRAVVVRARDDRVEQVAPRLDGFALAALPPDVAALTGERPRFAVFLRR